MEEPIRADLLDQPSGRYPAVMASMNSGFGAHVDRFKHHLPGVFTARGEDWQREDWIDVGSDELIEPGDWLDPAADPARPVDEGFPTYTDRLDFDVEGYLAERLGVNRALGRVILPPGKLRGGHPGGPVRVGGTWDPGRPPPPEAIAFYLPAHYFPVSHGIYFIFENWVQFCVALHGLAAKHGPAPTPRQLIEASIRYLYPHEYYHHKVEMFGFRWEAFVRARFYAKSVSSLYKAAPSLSEDLEESLATAFGLFSVQASVRAGRLPESLLKALEDYCLALPPHYSRGVAVFRQDRFDVAESSFLERCSIHTGSKRYSLASAEIWESVPYRMAGSIRPGSAFTFLIDRRNTVLSRLRLGLRAMRVREIRRELDASGYRLERQGGNHEIWSSADGKRIISVPRHPGDLRPGLVRRMLKQMRGG